MQWAITAEHDFKLKSDQMECSLSNSAALSIWVARYEQML
jgi:hypothetical protein